MNDPLSHQSRAPQVQRQPRRKPRRNETTRRVQTHQIGAGYGPYSPAFQPAATAAVPYVWEKNDEYEDPDPEEEQGFVLFSPRGWMNVGAVVVIIGALLTLFIGWPIILQFGPTLDLGPLNGTGQVPAFINMPAMIDPDTPVEVYTRTGTDGQQYDLVFSDEFNVEGRSFYPGDDPFWEGQDMWYWPTGDIEWYDPGAITTEDGKLVITISEQRNHDLNFLSGMLTSWNKLCFTTGYVEASISLPGSPRTAGLWPGMWMLGNLGRAGFGSTTEGVWPYTYDTCDLGTFPNQTDHNGNPSAAKTGGEGGQPLSFLPGQRLSACTCPGSDHPGPDTSVGRGSPEIDILEAKIDTHLWQGQISQSFQVAPYNMNYKIDMAATTIYNDSITAMNSYTGGTFQQAVSALSYVDSGNYDDAGYATYAVEWWSNPDQRSEGYITWFSQGNKTWTATADAVGSDPVAQIGPRLISEEPMYLIFNLAMAPSFQKQDFKHLVFPSRLRVDYVRVYQRHGLKDTVGCDPKSRPTLDYINNHLPAYTNPNFTTWYEAGYYFPRNSVYDGC